MASHPSAISEQTDLDLDSGERALLRAELGLLELFELLHRILLKELNDISATQKTRFTVIW
jgi:hypothetical protein